MEGGDQVRRGGVAWTGGGLMAREGYVGREGRMGGKEAWDWDC